jgi:hypothetical protein
MLAVTRFAKPVAPLPESHGAPKGVIANPKIEIAIACCLGDSSRLLEA